MGVRSFPTGLEAPVGSLGRQARAAEAPAAGSLGRQARVAGSPVAGSLGHEAPVAGSPGHEARAAGAPAAGSLGRQAPTAVSLGHEAGSAGSAARATTQAGLSRLLELADSRSPTGAHAHSGGVEQAIARAMVHDTASLQWFIRRRLATAGLLASAAAAQACRIATAPDAAAELAVLDLALDVRTPSQALRDASRTQGRGLLRLSRRLVAQLPDMGSRPHHPVALGAVAGHLGLTDRQVAVVAAQLTASGIAGAAQRLLALDPLTVTAGLIELADVVERAADAGWAATELPDLNDPLADLLAEEHTARRDRYFVS